MITALATAHDRIARSKLALMKPKNGNNGNGRNGFDPASFLATAGVGRTLAEADRQSRFCFRKANPLMPSSTYKKAG